MTQHPAEGTLQAYLDGEILSEPREALDRHLHGCRTCRATLNGLDAMADATGSALAAMDVTAPDPETVRWAVRQARAAARGRTHRRRAAAAASLALLCGAGWAAAMPGSPIRSWWTDRSSDEPPATAEQEVVGVVDAVRTGVSVMPLDGRVTVHFVSVPRETWLEVRIVDAEPTTVSAPGGSRFETGTGRVQVDLAELPGDLLVEIPSTAILADIFIDGSRVFLKSGTEVSYPGPAPVPTGAGSVRLQTESSP